MALFNLCLSPVALLLMFMCPRWQLSQASPVRAEGQVSDRCVSQAQSLLWNITESLSKKELFSGIDCAKQSIELNEETQTAMVCAPKGLTCSGTMKSEFNKELCLKNIRKDLEHYYKFFSAQPDPDNLIQTTILSSLQELMQQCFTSNFEEVEDKVSVNHQSNYAKRLKLCKVLRGFHVRSITINRAVNYMNSGEDEQ